ncbi:MAG TPA: class I SAM-dependent methyltransferase [Clostridiales bacterium]|nr:class I SAM-dependent methyltransferase [Clostridiales bacterium]
MGILQKIKRKIFQINFERKEVQIDKKIGGLALNKRLETKHQSEGAKDTQSTDYRLLGPIFEKVVLTSKDKFVDVGCGQGRVLSYLLTEKDFKGELVGIELSTEVAVFTKKRFDGYSQVEIINKNAVESIPADGSVFYLFNPFDGTVLKAFLDSFEKTVKNQAILIYAVPVHHTEFDGREKFSLVETFAVKREFMEYDAQIAIYKFDPQL